MRHSSHLIIWDSEGNLGNLELSNYMLSKNTEFRLEQSLASAYILYFYKLHGLYILG